MTRGRTLHAGICMLATSIILGGCAPFLERESPIDTPTPQPHAEPAQPSRKPPTPVTSEPTKPAPQAESDTWTTLASRFHWPTADHAAVRTERERLLARRRSLTNKTNRAEPYLWYIADALETRRLPAELALLPLIESGFRSGANSPYGAAGLWQFTANTGRRFGLVQSPWYDGRADVVASTNAALDYLERLHGVFDGDWLLALAAYNCGPGAVRRAIRKHGVADFWRIIDDLPSETREHVPRLLAAVQIIAEPARYGVKLRPVANAPYFAVVELGGPFDLSHFAELPQWPAAEFKRLNAGYLRPYTGSDGPLHVLVPLAWRERVFDLVQNLPPDQRVRQRSHTVRSGETLSGIAQRYGVPVQELRQRNKLRGSFLKAGSELIVPVLASDNVPTSDDPATAAAVSHTVRTGDSLWSLGERYGCGAQTIARLNGITLDTMLQPGQVLRIGRGAGAGTYAVAAGDSLWTIARRFKVTVKQLRAWNTLTRRQILQPGQALIVSEPPEQSGHNI